MQAHEATRRRAPSTSGSLTSSRPPAPYNTPATNSVAEAFPRFDTDAALDRINRTIDGMRLTRPTVLANEVTSSPSQTSNTTPITTGALRPLSDNLPRIEESLELLPPRATTTLSMELSAPSSPGVSGATGEHGTFTFVWAKLTSLGTPPISIPEGVREFTDWEEMVYQDLDRVLARLTNLAYDDAARDPSKSAAEHFRSRLMTQLNDPSRRFPFGELPPVHTRPSPDASGVATPIAVVSKSGLNDQKQRLDRLVQAVERLANANEQSREESAKLMEVCTKIVKKDDA